MKPKLVLQEKKLTYDKVLVWLNYYLKLRGYSKKELAQRLVFSEIHFLNVSNGKKPVTDNFLWRLESFYLEDNRMQRVAIENKIRELERLKEHLLTASVETFYAERARPKPSERMSGYTLNEPKAAAGANIFGTRAEDLQALEAAEQTAKKKAQADPPIS